MGFSQMSGEPQREKEAKAEAPELEWLADGVPRATQYADTYFSKAGGLAETRHVFLGGNGLPERFEGRERFTIAELGFGTGLNFLATLSERDQAGGAAGITFVSFEKYPMTQTQLAHALAPWTELADHAGQLTARWAPRPGWQEVEFGKDRLVLGIGDAKDLLPDLDTGSGQELGIGPVDAWFLDGFSPARNPDLWEADLLAAAFNATAPGGTFATYTAAGWVRRNLIAAGFEVQRTKGFAGKREMMCGARPQETQVV